MRDEAFDLTQPSHAGKPNIMRIGVNASEFIVFFVRADPIPNENIRREKMTNGPVVAAGANRLLPLVDLFELQRGMKWIGQPERVIFLGKFLNPRGQFIVTPPELRVGFGLHFF